MPGWFASVQHRPKEVTILSHAIFASGFIGHGYVYFLR